MDLTTILFILSLPFV